MQIRRSVPLCVAIMLVAATSTFGQWRSSGSILYTDPASTTVGIGTASPVARLEIADDAKRIRLLFSGTEYLQGPLNSGGFAMILGVNRGNNRQLWLTDSGQLGGTGDAAASVMRLMLLNNKATLDAISTELQPRSLTIGGTGGLILLPDGGNMSVLPTGNGKIGFGTNPVRAFDVQAAADTSTFPGTPTTIRVADSNLYSTANTGPGIAFDAKFNSGAAMATIGAISAIKESTADGNYAGALTFGTRANGSTGGVTMERMRITSTGHVIIAPAGATGTKLTVNGDVSITGNIGAKFQDLAEWVPADRDLAPGTVVVLDSSVSNRVTASVRPYDTAVAGVVSAQPGVILGEAGPAKEQIATTGRVKVRVDATRSPIRIGDLLVTSDKPGVAMRSEQVDVGGIAIHRPGTVLGKALEPLDSGAGEILVLLSLQ